MATTPRRPFAGTCRNPIPSTPDSLPDWLQVPYSGHRSFTATPASASRRKPMICSSEKRFFTSNLRLVGDWTPNRPATQRWGDVGTSVDTCWVSPGSRCRIVRLPPVGACRMPFSSVSHAGTASQLEDRWSAFDKAMALAEFALDGRLRQCQVPGTAPPGPGAGGYAAACTVVYGGAGAESGLWRHVAVAV